MFQIQPLQNFPQTRIDLLREIYDSKDGYVGDRPWMQKKFLDYGLEPDHRGFEAIDEIRQHAWKIFFLESQSKEGYFSIHTDIQRQVVLNIPIYVDHDRSSCFIGNQEELSKYPKLFTYKSVQHGGTIPRYAFSANHYDSYKLTLPTIVNVHLPHTWTNTSGKTRVVASVSFHREMTPDDVMRIIPKEWL